MRCPCRKKSETVGYADCCGPYHDGGRTAPSAEALMRSRYSAFAMKNRAYLLATWHASTRPALIELDPTRDWVQLRVLAVNESGDNATVQFIAKSRWSAGGQIDEQAETSRFVREDGRWLYLDGKGAD